MESTNGRSERDCPVSHHIGDWFHAKPIADQEEALVPIIPQTERKHATESVDQTVYPPLAIPVNEHLGVRVTLEAMTVTFKLSSEIAKVVDGPVEDDGDVPFRAQHWLPTGIGQVEDREPTMSKDSVWPSLNALAVWPSTRERTHHTTYHFEGHHPVL
jgi:hypothetical protein